MTTLLYREDIDEVRARLTTWWNGGDIGRPVMCITAPRRKPVEALPARPKPAGWVTDYSISDFDYRVYIAAVAHNRNEHFGESVPTAAAHLGPGSVALYLGSRGVELPGTTWFEPCIESPEKARFEYDRSNLYWDFTLRLIDAHARAAKGKFLLEYPDLIEGLDILASMRGTEPLLFDLVERPEWVRECMRRITDLYFRYHDRVYDRIRDDIGGSVYWVWAPGRMAKLQCDFSAMISAAQFRDFMLPVLQEMTERLSYTLYHWDGPGAIQHHDALLSLPRLQVIQWTPGSGVEPTWDRRWWPLFHKTFEAGKGIYIHLGGKCTVERIEKLKREFKGNFRKFMLVGACESSAVAREIVKTSEL
jgi:5-methyltetrahydrofolate--homocysteine methyltransferase